jgi:hypothetical protein
VIGAAVKGLLLSLATFGLLPYWGWLCWGLLGAVLFPFLMGLLFEFFYPEEGEL